MSCFIGFLYPESRFFASRYNGGMWDNEAAISRRKYFIFKRIEEVV